MKRVITVVVVCFIIILTSPKAYCQEWREATIWILENVMDKESGLKKMTVKLRDPKGISIDGIPLNRIKILEIKEEDFVFEVDGRFDPDSLYAGVSTSYSYKMTGYNNETAAYDDSRSQISNQKVDGPSGELLEMDSGFKISTINLGANVVNTYYVRKPLDGVTYFDSYWVAETWVNNCRASVRKIIFK